MQCKSPIQRPYHQMPSASELPKYLSAAKRKHADAAAIYSTAEAAGFAADQLARLADTLREHQGFKLTAEQRDRLIDGLLDGRLGKGWTPSKIADRVGCSRTTVYRRAEAPRPTPSDPLNKPAECPVLTPRGQVPILSFSSAGTPWSEHREIQRLLAG